MLRCSRTYFGAIRLLSALAGIMAPAVTLPANASLQRTATGQYLHRNLADGKVLGSESFQLSVYADGTRCLLIWSNGASRGTQITSQVCVDSAFRPVDAYARYWIAGKFRGSGWIRVKGESVDWLGEAAGAPTSAATLDAPLQFSVGTHPISGDAWHIAALGANGGASTTSLTINPSGNASDSLTAAWVTIPIERMGEQAIKVPAGRFETRRFRLAGQTEYWVFSDDWLVARSVSGQTERVLVEFRSGS